jgi:hypothetical protein
MVNCISRCFRGAFRAVASFVSSICSRVSALASRIFKAKDEEIALNMDDFKAEVVATIQRDHKTAAKFRQKFDQGLSAFERDTWLAFDSLESKIHGQCAKVESASLRIFSGIDRVAGVNQQQVDALIMSKKAEAAKAFKASFPEVPNHKPGL